jgi:hypothetical protein
VHFGDGLRGFWRDGFARRGAEIVEERRSGSGKYGVLFSALISRFLDRVQFGG